MTMIIIFTYCCSWVGGYLWSWRTMEIKMDGEVSVSWDEKHLLFSSLCYLQRISKTQCSLIVSQLPHIPDGNSCTIWKSTTLLSRDNLWSTYTTCVWQSRWHMTHWQKGPAKGNVKWVCVCWERARFSQSTLRCHACRRRAGHCLHSLRRAHGS